MAAEFLNAVIDISHHNGNVNLKKAADAGILGIIQKATQGQSGTDPTFRTNRNKAKDAGILFGAYHFATGSDGIKQADNFLTTVGDFENVLLVLDFEPNPTGPSMALEEARAFVTHVKEATGRFPGFYSGHYIKQLLGTNKDPILAQCWFWLAQYGPTPVVPPNWQAWTRWCHWTRASQRERRGSLRSRQVQRYRAAASNALAVDVNVSSNAAQHVRPRRPVQGAGDRLDRAAVARTHYARSASAIQSAVSGRNL